MDVKRYIESEGSEDSSNIEILVLNGKYGRDEYYYATGDIEHVLEVIPHKFIVLEREEIEMILEEQKLGESGLSLILAFDTYDEMLDTMNGL